MHSEIPSSASGEARSRSETEPLYPVGLFLRGRMVEAYELVRNVRPPIPLANQTQEVTLLVRTMVSVDTGQGLSELNRDMTQALSQGVRAGDHAAAGIAALALGATAFHGARYRDAARWLAEAQRHFEDRDTFDSLLIAGAFQVGGARFTGDSRGAAQALSACLQALKGNDPLPTQLPYVIRARAWAAAARGDAIGARRVLLDSVEIFSEVPVYAALSCYEAMHTGADARSLVAPLAELRERCDAPAVSAYADHVVARSCRDGAGLLKVADPFEQLGLLRCATEAAADAAQGFAEEGRQDSARRAAARCRELFALGQAACRLQALPPSSQRARPSSSSSPHKD